MGDRSTNDADFLREFEHWFSDRPEILVLFRYPNAAGNRDFEFFTSFLELMQRLETLRPKTSVIAFRKSLLPLRGVVDDEFIEKCLAVIPPPAEYLIVETKLTTYGKHSWFRHHEGVSHAQLREDLEDRRGESVAAGVFPDWLKDSEGVISAIVPDEDGGVRRAAY